MRATTESEANIGRVVDRPSPPATYRPAGEEISERLVVSRQITESQLDHARRVQQKLSGRRSLLAILTELYQLSDAQIRAALRSGPVQAPLGALLVDLGLLSESDLKLALAFQRDTPGMRLAELLAEHHFITESQVFGVLADKLALVPVEPGSVALDRDLLRRAPAHIYRTNEFIPLTKEQQRVVVAFASPQNARHVEVARQHFGEIVVGLASRSAVLAAIARAERLLASSPPTTGSGDGAVVATVNRIIQDALAERASDIHLEPGRDRLRIRFRQDGTMMPYKEVPLDQAAALVSRIKVIAGADIAERRRHQDGRIQFEAPSGAIDIRVSSYVTVYGEKIVLRLLNSRDTLLPLKDIGMAPRMLQFLQDDALETPSGVVIVTGPTGSGKTTTLYAAVNHLNNPQTSIITAEDPVEYLIDGVSQCSINPKIDLSYAETLKHIVRQDPDVIVIGEIRDHFSAEVAITAALTGHKVLTTFHTEDSIGGLVRLLNMNIESFLISSTVVSVVAQRLVRRVCPHCAEPHVLSPHEIRRLGFVASEAESLTFMRGRGCDACRFLGYRGRFAVFELLVLNERVRDAVLQRCTSSEIRRISIESSGLVTLLEDAVVKGAAGLTTFDEIVRHVPRLARPRPLAELRRLLGVRE